MELADSKYDVYDIPVELIYTDPDFNCRRGIPLHSVEELAQQIQDSDGLIIPVIIQPAEEVEDVPEQYEYRLVCGFRRYKAMVEILHEKVIQCQIRIGLTEREASILNLQENRARSNLSLMEEARAVVNRFPDKWPSTRVARELKCDVEWVRLRRKLFTLPQWILKETEAGVFGVSDIRMILSSAQPEWRATLIKRAVGEGRKKNYYIKTDKRLISRKRKTNAEISEVAAGLLAEGFSPMLCRLLGWCTGDVSGNGLDQTLSWLRDRKGWLKND